MAGRYIRQETFREIGKEGQRILAESRVAIIGVGALGTVLANNLARAGVGFLRLIDRDVVEESNLQRQLLFTEQDARDGLPKAEAALSHLRQINSTVNYEAHIADVNSATVDAFISDVDLVLDGTDNFETRFLLNEACHHHQKPWIYTGSSGSHGMTMNFLQGEDRPCLRCMMSYDVARNAPTCATEGILNSTTMIVSSLESNEAIKILLQSGRVRQEMLFFDIWFNKSRKVQVRKNPECPVCGYGQYSFYGKSMGMQAAALCGRDSVQVIPAGEVSVDFDVYARRLEPFGEVTINAFTLDFYDGVIGIKLFRNGRAILRHVTDESRAKSIYTKYIGL